MVNEDPGMLSRYPVRNPPRMDLGADERTGIGEEAHAALRNQLDKADRIPPSVSIGAFRVEVAFAGLVQVPGDIGGDDADFGGPGRAESFAPERGIDPVVRQFPDQECTGCPSNSCPSAG
jgi:hypothetical protein